MSKKRQAGHIPAAGRWVEAGSHRATLHNAALQACVVTLPNWCRLHEYLCTLTSEADAAEIRDTLDRLISDLQKHLYSFDSPVVWTEAFEQELCTVLSNRYPWLDAESHSRLQSFSKWFCWHEGISDFATES